MRFSFIGMVFLSFACHADVDDNAKASAAKDQANESGRAMIKGDYTRIVDLTHPEVVRLAGGKEKMIEMLRNGMSQMKQDGTEILSATAGDPGKPVAAADELYVVVPLTLKMKIGDQTVTSPSHLIGVSKDDGKTWRFVDGARLNESNVRRVLPSFPAALKLPKKKPPREDGDS